MYLCLSVIDLQRRAHVLNSPLYMCSLCVCAQWCAVTYTNTYTYVDVPHIRRYYTFLPHTYIHIHT